MKKDIKNIEASIRSRLQNKARAMNCPFAEILQYYGMERFLYRFSQSAHARKFVLKGALMFTVWQIPQRRTTLDIDFLALYENKVNSIERVVKDVCKTKVVSDGLIFDVGSVSGRRIKEGADYEGVRVKFRGLLERSRISMQVDVGFGDIIYPRPKFIDYPSVLNFPKPHLKGYTFESVLAEKLEAMVKLGLLNSRMKDFYDLWLMIRQFNFKGARLQEAIRRTFQHRKTKLPEKAPIFADEIYDEKSDRQTLWKAFMTKQQIKYAPGKLKSTAETIENFLKEPIKAINKKEDFHAEWYASGPWK